MNNCQNNNINYTNYDNYINKCITNSGSCLPTYKMTGLNDDVCTVKQEYRESVMPGMYNLSNFKSCDCNHDNVIKTALNNQTIFVNDGYGTYGNKGCLIDNNSNLRIGELTDKNCINHLISRINDTPNMSRGPIDVCAQSIIFSPEYFTRNKACNTATATDYNRNTPLVPCLKSNIQNPKHIIPEMSDASWVRGGISTRDLVKNTNYLNICT